MAAGEAGGPGPEALRALLAKAADDDAAHAQAMLALMRTEVVVPTWAKEPDVARTLASPDGAIAVPLFTGLDTLEVAAKRFGWLDKPGELSFRVLAARDALIGAIAQGAAYVVLDVMTEHVLELSREELAPMVRPRAAVAPAPSAREERVAAPAAPAPVPREERVAPAPVPREERVAPAPIARDARAPVPREERVAPIPRQERPASVPREERAAPMPREQCAAPAPRQERAAPVPQQERAVPTAAAPVAAARAGAGAPPPRAMSAKVAPALVEIDDPFASAAPRARKSPPPPAKRDDAPRGTARRVPSGAATPLPRHMPSAPFEDSPATRAGTAATVLVEPAAKLDAPPAPAPHDELPRMPHEGLPRIPEAPAAAAPVEPSPAVALDADVVVRDADDYDFGGPSSEHPRVAAAAPAPAAAARAPIAAPAAARAEPIARPAATVFEAQRPVAPAAHAQDGARNFGKTTFEHSTSARGTGDFGAPAPASAAASRGTGDFGAPAAGARGTGDFGRPAGARATGDFGRPAGVRATGDFGPADATRGEGDFGRTVEETPLRHEPRARAGGARSTQEHPIESAATITAEPAHVAPAAAPAPLAAAKLELGTPLLMLDDSILSALAEALRKYPEVEWACQLDDGTPTPVIGVRVEPSYLERIDAIERMIAQMAEAKGAPVRVQRLQETALMREARSKGTLFFPWRKKK